jgi:hypothetical protein
MSLKTPTEVAEETRHNYAETGWFFDRPLSREEVALFVSGATAGALGVLIGGLL